jgi:hypothetical protein
MIGVIIIWRMGNNQIGLAIPQISADYLTRTSRIDKAAIGQAKQHWRGKRAKGVCCFFCPCCGQFGARIITTGGPVGGNAYANIIATRLAGGQKPVEENFHIIGMRTYANNFHPADSLCDSYD